jgi:hypothetical protein
MHNKYRRWGGNPKFSSDHLQLKKSNDGPSQYTFYLPATRVYVGRRKFLERSTDIGNVAGCVPMVVVVAHREWTDSSMNRFERQDISGKHW